jgi:hypothetical protein
VIAVLQYMFNAILKFVECITRKLLNIRMRHIERHSQKKEKMLLTMTRSHYDEYPQTPLEGIKIFGKK